MALRLVRLFRKKLLLHNVMKDSTEKPKVEIEAPSADQIRAAKKIRRNMSMPHKDEQPIQEKKIPSIVDGRDCLDADGLGFVWLSPING